MIKLIRTILVSLVIISAGLLWFTRAEWLPSQSAFALSNNVWFYYTMHASMFFTYIISARVNRRWFNYFIAGGIIGIVAFDMYNFPWLHNAFTAMTFIMAIFEMIYFSSVRNRPINIFLACGAALYFLLGLYTNFHLFLAEAVAEFFVGSAQLRRIWIKKDA